MFYLKHICLHVNFCFIKTHSQSLFFGIAEIKDVKLCCGRSILCEAQFLDKHILDLENILNIMSMMYVLFLDIILRHQVKKRSSFPVILGIVILNNVYQRKYWGSNCAECFLNKSFHINKWRPRSRHVLNILM